MSFEELTYYRIACDAEGCENTCPTDRDEFSAWSDKDGAEMTAIESDWTAKDGKHFCEDHPRCDNCGGDAGDLSGERDYLCPACWRLVSA